MGKIYTLNQHFNNLTFIEEFIRTSTTMTNIEKKFNLINSLKNFIKNNVQFNSMQSFVVLNQALLNFIKCYSNDNYSKNKLDEMLINITKNTKVLFKDINNLYKINLYFRGKDKYGLLQNILKENVTLKLNEDIINNDTTFNILIISEDTFSENLNFDKFDKIIYFDKFMKYNLSIVKQIYAEDYDYHYLAAGIDIAKEHNTETIIVGSSYPLYGIDTNTLNENVVQLSLPSQDLYYSFKIVKDVIENNDNIKKCIIGTAYWLFHVDLSKCSSEALLRIPSVYYPIFEDNHNYSYINKIHKKSLKDFVDKDLNFIFNIDELDRQLNKIIFKTYKSYFNNLKNRQNSSLLGNRRLSSLNINEKLNLAKDRAYSHNKMLLYLNTKNEYINILKKFLEYLNTKNIKPIIINFATSKYYNEFFDKEFISEYKKIIGNLSKIYNFRFLDLNDYDIFKEEDFVDFDHMSDNGSIKVSKILNEL